MATWSFGPDSASVLTVDPQAHVARWKGMDFREPESMMDLGTQLSPCGWPLRYPVLFSRDARLLAAGSTDGVIKVWDLEQRALLREFRASTGSVAPLGFPAQRKSLVVFAFNDRSIHEWDLAGGQEVCTWRQAPSEPYAAFSQDGQWSLVLDYVGSTLLREMATRHDSNLKLDFQRGQRRSFFRGWAPLCRGQSSRLCRGVGQSRTPGVSCPSWDF
jgi:WD40 repeat protein